MDEKRSEAMNFSKLGLHSTCISDNFSSVKLNNASWGKVSLLSIDAPSWCPGVWLKRKLTSWVKKRTFFLREVLDKSSLIFVITKDNGIDSSQHNWCNTSDVTMTTSINLWTIIKSTENLVRVMDFLPTRKCPILYVYLQFQTRSMKSGAFFHKSSNLDSPGTSRSQVKNLCLIFFLYSAL